MPGSMAIETFSLYYSSDVDSFVIGHNLCLRVYSSYTYHVEDRVLSVSDGAECEVDLYVLVTCFVDMRE